MMTSFGVLATSFGALATSFGCAGSALAALAGFAGHWASRSITLVTMPATPTSLSSVSRSRDRDAVCNTSSRCFATACIDFPRAALDFSSSQPRRLRIFFNCTSAATAFEKQKNLRPSWIVPDPARLPPGMIFHCFRWPMWSIIMKVASDTFWASSMTMSRGSFALKAAGMLWITGNSLHHRCVRRALASWPMMVLAWVS
mmetsp:Transcript_24598/g.64952  ORF Transcript_24598/g.64952 Transcript_24598/m.64952 type:complete len:200 (+) Transcript_24598:659-1258(+)